MPSLPSSLSSIKKKRKKKLLSSFNSLKNLIDIKIDNNNFSLSGHSMMCTRPRVVVVVDFVDYDFEVRSIMVLGMA